MAEQELRRRRSLRLGFRLLTILGFCFALATLTPIDFWWARMLAGPPQDPAGDVLVVLGGGAFEDGTMGISSYLRSVYALRRYRQGGIRQIVVTGGSTTGPATSLGMSDFLRSQGVPPELIRIETASQSTRENALFTWQLLENLPGRKVLLTSDYHMFRARGVFAKLGIPVLPRPIPDAEKRAGSLALRWPVFVELAEETMKIGYYWVRGWI